MVKKKIVKKTAIRKQNSKKTRTRKEPSSSQLFNKVVELQQNRFQKLAEVLVFK